MKKITCGAEAAEKLLLDCWNQKSGKAHLDKLTFSVIKGAAFDDLDSGFNGLNLEGMSPADSEMPRKSQSMSFLLFVFQSQRT